MQESGPSSATRRYSALWEQATADPEGPVAAEVTEPYVEGSLRPQVTTLFATVGGEVLALTNGQAAFMAEDPSVLDRLGAFEALITPA